MTLSFYQIDAFTTKIFSGNPAAVIPLEEWLEEALLQKIAMENNLSETAFFVPTDKGYHIRWFTPRVEVDLCGHATLASAYVIFNFLNSDLDSVEFKSNSGFLAVEKLAGGLKMDFPADVPVLQSQYKSEVETYLGTKVIDVYQGQDDLMAVVQDEATVRTISPDMTGISTLENRGLIVTATGEKSDFVSRCFFPSYGIPEDPVTGSAHCLMVPYWAKKLEKKDLIARQLSPRGGEIQCEWRGARVFLTGACCLYMQGIIELK